MSTELNFFPVLSEDHQSKIGYEATPYMFNYLYNNEERELLQESLEEKGMKDRDLKILDKHTEWTPDSYELRYSRTFIINTPKFLFGSKGLACESAELGLALLWTSKSSNQRGVHTIGHFKNQTDLIELKTNSYFPKGLLKGRMEMQTILYINTPGQAQSFEQHLANESGMVLGVLDKVTVHFDGNGSSFPIIEVDEPSEPLWWVQCDWVDPLMDEFSEENVRICINKANPDFKKMKPEEGIKQSPLFKEVLASALAVIIQKAKQSDWWDEIMSGQNAEQGSIAQALRYFVETFDWDASSPERLAFTIRKYLESKM